jgi:hypothetical protein
VPSASAGPDNEEDFIAHFARTFQRERFVGLARASQWLRRQGKIDAFEFLAGLVFGQMSALRLTLNAQAACCTEAVSRQAVDQRYHERTVTYFRSAFDHCLARSLALAPEPALHAALAAHFPAIHLVDSSGFDCPASLASLYPGCGGDASPANVKLLLRYEYLRSQFAPVTLVPGKRSDQGLAGEVPRLIHAGELLIADKAFVKLQALRDIQQAGGYFLLPWPRSVNASAILSATTVVFVTITSRSPECAGSSLPLGYCAWCSWCSWCAAVSDRATS